MVSSSNLKIFFFQDNDEMTHFPYSNHFRVNMDPITSTLKIEEACFSETLASTYSIKRRQTLGD